MTARAQWDARGEEPEALAERIAVQLAAYDELLGTGDPWTLVEEDDRVVSADAASLTSVVSAHVHRDAEGIEFPTRGYVLNLAREGSAGFISIRYRVGAAKIVRRVPANGVQVTIAGPMRDVSRLSIDADLAEGVLHGLARAWDPDSAAVYDDAAAVASEGRGKFAPVIGQRTWVSDRLGTADTSTSGVRVERGDRGWYLTADDALDSESAVRKVWASLQANEITEITRAAARSSRATPDESHYPNWVRGDRVLVRAAWDGRPSEVPDLADRLLVLLRDVDGALGDRRPWNVDGVGLIDDYSTTVFTELIRSGVERGDDGTEWPTHGYNVLAGRSGGRGSVSFSLRVGALIPGRRRPANSVTATVAGPDVDGVRRVPTVEFVEAVLRAVVRAWDPDTAAAYDREAARATEGAGRFAPIVGQRAWVSRRVGTVETVTSGVTARAEAQGSYLDADDALDSSSAAREVRASLRANGIETIPRAL